MEIQSIGLAGLEKAQEKLAAVAKKSSGAARISSGDGEDVVDLSAKTVALLEAKNAASVNLKLVETANEMAAGSGLLDVLG